MTNATDQERAPVADLSAAVQEATGQTVTLVYVDQGYTGTNRRRCGPHGIRLELVKPDETKKGFVLLPRRGGVERSFAWMGRFRRLTREYERLTKTHAG